MQHLMAFWNPARWTGEMLQQAALLRCELAPCHPSPSVSFQGCVFGVWSLKLFKLVLYTVCPRIVMETLVEKKKKKKEKKKEHLYFLSRIWQRNNWFGIHCHIQRHYLTWCLADSNRVQIERQCHREKEMSCLLHLPFRLLPFIASLSLSLLFKPERNDQSHSPPTLHEVDDKWQDMSDVSVRLNACIRLLSRCLVCSVGCWRAFCKTEGLGCRAGREPAILMIFFFFFFFLSGCITISLEVPSVHQGHAIHCRECVIGARHLPSFPGIF